MIFMKENLDWHTTTLSFEEHLDDIELCIMRIAEVADCFNKTI